MEKKKKSLVKFMNLSFKTSVSSSPTFYIDAKTHVTG